MSGMVCSRRIQYLELVKRDGVRIGQRGAAGCGKAGDLSCINGNEPDNAIYCPARCRWQSCRDLEVRSLSMLT